MNKKGSAVIIGVCITVIIAVITLSIAYTSIENQQSTTTVTDDLFTAVNGSCERVVDECIQSTTSIKNASADITGNFTLCGSSGDLYGYMLNVEGADPNLDSAELNASYIRISCSYIPSGTTRTIINYVPILLVVVLLAFLGFYAGIKR